jgi:Glucodextranase, domain B/PASTA domain
MKLRALLVGCVVVVAYVLIPADGALAFVSGSTLTVTSPHKTYLLDDRVTPNETITGTVTSDGHSGDSLDINCYAGSSYSTLVSNVPVNVGKSSFSGSLMEISDRTCVLRAVPHGDSTDYPPGTSSHFEGPTLAIGHLSNTTVSSGTNSGRLEFYDLYDSQLRGGFDFSSLGDCTISGSFTYDPVTFGANTTDLDDCNAWFNSANGLTAAGFAPPTRSELQVDGANAYAPGGISALFSGAEHVPGFPSLSYTYSLDPSTGNLVINELDQIVKCSPGGYPATGGNCTSFAPTGVQVALRITQGANGRVASAVQYFSSTDGHAHNVDLLEDNTYFQANEDQLINFQWTGAGMRGYTTPGQAISAPKAPGPGSFFVKGSAAVPDGGEATAQGSTTFSNPPTGVTIVGTTSNSLNYSWVDLHYARTVPAKGSVALGFSYGNAFLASEVAGYAKAAEAAFLPQLRISSPLNGHKTASERVSGQASDANGLVSLIVNGHRAKVGSSGNWSLKLALKRGRDKIIAVATNVFGNTTTVTETVKFNACVVPKLKGKSLKAARRLLKHAGCKLGKVSGPTSSHVKVTKQRPKPHTVLRPGGKVRVKTA